MQSVKAILSAHYNLMQTPACRQSETGAATRRSRAFRDTWVTAIIPIWEPKRVRWV